MTGNGISSRQLDNPIRTLLTALQHAQGKSFT